jgi:serine/threonine-protein kinase
MGDPTEPDAGASLVGATLGGKYLLRRLLGSGGFGHVYEATNVNTGGLFAVKTLHAYLVSRPGMLQRFLAEARVATRIQHENVIKVFDLDVDDALQVPYIVQELLSGETLDQRLDRAPERRLSPEDALRIVVPVMGALVAAHALGFVHRDLKPENIFLARRRSGEEVPTVIDFGIAKFSEDVLSDKPGTQAGVLLGSPMYMAPEQARGEVQNIGVQTDVWALGVVLYETLTGRLPYEAENPQLVLGMIQFQEPVTLAQRAPELAPDLVAVIDRAITRDRARRHLTMQAFLGALLETSAWTGGTPVAQSATLPAEPPPLEAVPPRGRRGETLREGWSSETTRATPTHRRLGWIALALMLVTAAMAGVARVVGRDTSTPSSAASQPPSTPVPVAVQAPTTPPVVTPTSPPAPVSPPVPVQPVDPSDHTTQATRSQPATRSHHRPRAGVRSGGARRTTAAPSHGGLTLPSASEWHP